MKNWQRSMIKVNITINNEKRNNFAKLVSIFASWVTNTQYRPTVSDGTDSKSNLSEVCYLESNIDTKILLVVFTLVLSPS